MLKNHLVNSAKNIVYIPDLTHAFSLKQNTSQVVLNQLHEHSKTNSSTHIISYCILDHHGA